MNIEKIVKAENKKIDELKSELNSLVVRGVEIDEGISRTQQGLDLLAPMEQNQQKIYDALGTPMALEDLERIQLQIKEASDKLQVLYEEKGSDETRNMELERQIKAGTNKRDIADYLVLSAEIQTLRENALNGDVSSQLKALVRTSELHRGSEIISRLDRGVMV